MLYIERRLLKDVIFKYILRKYFVIVWQLHNTRLNLQHPHS